MNAPGQQVEHRIEDVQVQRQATGYKEKEKMFK
jgi:hypothetical protein